MDVKIVNDADSAAPLAAAGNHTAEGSQQGPTLCFRGVGERRALYLEGSGARMPRATTKWVGRSISDTIR